MTSTFGLLLPSFIQDNRSLSGSVSLLLALFALSCGPSKTSIRPPDPTPVDFASLPDQSRFPDAGAVVIRDEGTMEVYARGNLPFGVFERHRIVRVLNSRGRSAGNIAIPYSTRSEVTSIEACTILPDGTTLPLKEDAVFDVTLYPNFVFYSDQRAKIFTMPGVEDGAVLDIRYSMTVYDRGLWHAWNFQSEFPTLQSTFTMKAPSEWKILWRAYGTTTAPAVTKAPPGFSSTTVWEMHDIPALMNEPGMPPASEVLVRLAVVPQGFETWDDVGGWFRELNAAPLVPGPEVRKRSREICGGSTDPCQKLERLFTWVRDHVRYIAVEIGIGGFQPHPAENVCVNRYGDCKDMVTLLCALGQEAGIEIHPAYLGTRFSGRADTSLPSPLQFDHVIAYAPSVGGGVWMDPTDGGVPFGDLPWYDQNVGTLIVEDPQTVVQMTPASSARANSRVTDFAVTLGPGGNAHLEGTILLRGAEAAESRMVLRRMDHRQRMLRVQTDLATFAPGPVLDTLAIEGLTPCTDPLVLRIAFHTPSFAMQTEAGLLLNPARDAGALFDNEARQPKRTHPLRTEYRQTESWVWRFNVPTGYAGPKQGGADSVRTEFGTAHWTLIPGGGEFRIEHDFALDVDTVRAEQSQAFHDFLDRIRLIGRPVILPHLPQ